MLSCKYMSRRSNISAASVEKWQWKWYHHQYLGFDIPAWAVIPAWNQRDANVTPACLWKSRQCFYCYERLSHVIFTFTVIHYFITGLMIITSVIGFLNSCVVMNRSGAHNAGRNITTWLLLDSLFETTRVIYVFICEIVIKGKGPIQIYELLISAAQYCKYICFLLLNTFYYLSSLYCQQNKSKSDVRGASLRFIPQFGGYSLRCHCKLVYPSRDR